MISPRSLLGLQAEDATRPGPTSVPIAVSPLLGWETHGSPHPCGPWGFLLLGVLGKKEMLLSWALIKVFGFGFN